MTRNRIDLIDAARGGAVVLMVVHHFLFNLTEFCNAPLWLYTNPVFDVLHCVFAGLFIALSGVSSQFSRSNIKRGLKVLAIALGISVVTFIMDMPILFGILHLLGFSMLFYGLTRKTFDKIPKKIMPFLFTTLIITGALTTQFITINSKHLWILGWTAPGFTSYDYFPIIPWLFVFFLGVWVGTVITTGKMPKKFYTVKVKFLPIIGRHALIIYILHQPILYGLTQLGIALF